jgi:hypothetical protein
LTWLREDAPFVNALQITVAASNKMQSRVAAGLSVAAGFPDNVVHNLQQYEDAVVAMATATGRTRLAERRQRVLAAREHSPYFNSRDWVRCFEVGVRRAWLGVRRASIKGQPLGHISVAPQSCIDGYGTPAGSALRAAFTEAYPRRRAAATDAMSPISDATSQQEDAPQKEATLKGEMTNSTEMQKVHRGSPPA